MAQLIIGIDHGFGRVKTAHTDMVTSAASCGCRPAVPSRLLLTVAEDGRKKYYELGGRRTPVHSDKTSDDMYWHLTLGAVAEEIEARGEERTQRVLIAAGLPISHLKSGKEAFRDYLARGGPHRYTLGEREYEITIDDVFVYPQGYAALVPILGSLRSEPVVHIVDIGSWTTDMMTMECGRTVSGTEKSREIGAISCIEQITDAVSAGTCPFEPRQIEEALLGGGHMPAKIQEKIMDCAGEWARSLPGMLRQCGIRMETAPVYFVGGGALLLRRYLPEKMIRSDFFEVHFQTDLHANAIGFQLMCERQLYTENQGAA